MLRIDYRPPGPVAAAFMASDAFVRGLRGPIGSGKSTACIMEILARATEQRPGPDGKRRTRWAVIRNTFPELKTTTVKSWHQWVPPSLGRWREQGPPMHHIEAGDLDMEVLFLALDAPGDVAKLLSLELTGAWINEAREVPKAVLDALTGRAGRFPPARDGGASWSGVIMDTNPSDSDHWWYRLAEEQRPEGFAFFAQPSGLSERAENLANLPAGYYRRAAAGKDEGWISIYVHGEYGFVSEGKPVYPEYVDGLHCREIEPVPSWPLHVGLDFGLTPAAVLAQRAPAGQIRVIDELVSDSMGARAFGEELARLLKDRYGRLRVGHITGDPAGDARAQTDETTVFQVLRAVGIDAVPAPSNDWTLRRDAVALPLSRLVDGQPGLILSPRCARLRKGLAGGYAYRRLAIAGQERYRDVPDKNLYSHVCDALGYCLMGMGEGRAVLVRVGRPAQQYIAQTDFSIW